MGTSHRTVVFTAIMASFAAVLLIFYATFFRFKVYQVVITQPISGLTVDSPVEFNGVTVGHIGEIRFDERNPQVIVVYLHIRKGTPITQGTIGKVDISEEITEKLTGFPYTYISLHDAGKNQRPILVAAGQRYPTIQMSADVNTTPSLAKLSNAVQQYNNFLAPLFTPENIESLKELVFSLQQLTAVLAKNSKNLDDIMANTDKASKDFEPFLKSTNETLTNLKTETLPQIYDLTQNANDTLLSVQRLLGKINNNPTLLLRGEGLPKMGPGETLHSSSSKHEGK